MQSLNQSMLLNMPMAVPPLEEQHRIVSWIRGFHELCQSLANQLLDAERVAHTLLEASLELTLRPAS